MTKRSLPTPEELRQLLRYEPETGKFYWRPRPESVFSTDSAAKAWNARHAYKEAFVTISTSGYRKAFVNGCQVYAQRAAWAIYYGAWPEEQIDFKNTVKTDVRIKNLRPACHSQYLMNRRVQINNKSGQKGVSLRKDTKKWKATITAFGKEISIGNSFSTFEEAACAYKQASKRYHGEFSRTE